MRTHYLASVVLLALCPAPILAELQSGDPESVGMSRERLDQAAGLLGAEVGPGRVDAAAILVARHGTVVLHRGFGRLSGRPDAPAVQPDSIFIVASITKPVTVTALMILVERGRLALSDPVSLWIPEFAGGDRDKIRVHDLLAHTSGLPDRSPDNLDLRRAHAPLSEFVRSACKTPLLFSPGSNFRYQSMGTLLAAEIVQRISGRPLPEFEQKEIFQPLGMKNSSLGIGQRRIEDTVQVQDTPGTNPADRVRFGPNSGYWRRLGNPWACMHTTAGDLGILLQTMLDGGSHAGRRLLSPVTAKTMISNQNTHLNHPWGLGWALGRSTAWHVFGDLVSPSAFGHAGSAGAVAWADPETGLLCVILTSRPIAIDDGRLLRRVSNAVAAAVVTLGR